FPFIGACGFVIFPLMGGYGPGNWGMMGPGMMSGFGFPFLGGIGMLLFGAFIIIGIVLLAVWLAQNAGQSSTTAPRGETPLDILKARYAKGEITREQYEEMRRDLG
ncbi:MAG: SHOCT domain-containing protein, partial [Chloroflexi bacterium]|nr:SHOCT domain-containing protein [Chloroflexota bacterium]